MVGRSLQLSNKCQFDPAHVGAWHCDRLETRETSQCGPKKVPWHFEKAILHCVGLSCALWEISHPCTLRVKSHKVIPAFSDANPTPCLAAIRLQMKVSVRGTAGPSVCEPFPQSHSNVLLLIIQY